MATTEMESIAMQDPQQLCCVNCCSNLNVKTSSLESTRGDELESMEISTSLSSIYKLHYLTAFFDTLPLQSSVNGSGKLCNDCLQVFLNLYKFYQDFNHLRALESSLAKEIKMLDDCIQAHQLARNVKMEPESLSNCNQNDHDFLGDQEQDEEEEEEEIPVNYVNLGSTPNLSVNSGPWIVIQRLENDPLAQSLLTQTTTKTESKIAMKNSTSDDENNEDYDCDLDFAPNSEQDEDADSDYAENESKRKSWTTKAKAKSKTKSKKTTTARRNKKSKEISPPPPTRKSSRGRIPKVRSPAAEQPSSSTTTTTTTTTPTKRKKSSKEIPFKKKESRLQKEKRVAAIRREKARQNADKLASTRKRKREVEAYRRRKTKAKHPCWGCRLDFPSQDECFAHTMSEHFKEGDAICKHCSKISDSDVANKHHEIRCKKMKPGELIPSRICPICSKGFPSKWCLKVHVDSHGVGEDGKPRVITCTFEDCTYKTGSPLNLKAHINNTHADTGTRYKCDECGCSFKSKYKFKEHKKNRHTEEGLKRYKELMKGQRDRKKARKMVGFKGHICEECNVDLVTSVSLVRHRKIVHGVNLRHVCEKCAQSFSTVATLKRHLEHAHSDVRAYVCEFCGSAYKTQYNLNDHLRRMHDTEGRQRWAAQMKVWTARKKVRDQALAAIQRRSDNTATSTTTVDVNQSIEESQLLVNSSSSSSTTTYHLHQPESGEPMNMNGGSIHDNESSYDSSILILDKSSVSRSDSEFLY